MSCLVTVVTVCYNEEVRISDTIKSVLAAANEEVEYLIIDGASVDNTLNEIKRFEPLFKQKGIVYRWISEKDKGIYNAMNKAINMANGQYIININIGDTIDILPLKILQECIADSCVAVSFPIFLADEEKLFIPSFDKRLKTHNTIHHQGTFYKKNLVPQYNEDYKIFADFDLNQRIFKTDGIIKIYEEPIVSRHKNDGISENNNAAQELFAIIRKNFGIMIWIKAHLYFGIRGIEKRIGKI